MYTKFKHTTFYILHFVLMLFFIPSVLAADFGLDATAKEAGYKLDVPGPASIGGKIVGYLLAFVGVIFFALMLYGGILWMTARGDAEKVKKSQELIKSAIIGLIIVFLAYTLTRFIIGSLTQTAIQ